MIQATGAIGPNSISELSTGIITSIRVLSKNALYSGSSYRFFSFSYTGLGIESFFVRCPYLYKYH